MTGVSLAHQNNQEQAASVAFEKAIKSYHDAPPADLLMSYADFQLQAGNSTRYEQTLWRILSDHPTYAAAYDRLIEYHSNKGAAAAAINVLQKWLAADPSNTDARLAEAKFLVLSGQVDEGLRAAAESVRQNPQNTLVLGRAFAMYQVASRLPQYVQLLEELNSRYPRNIALADQLVEIYASQQRIPEATRVV